LNQPLSQGPQTPHNLSNHPVQKTRPHLPRRIHGARHRAGVFLPDIQANRPRLRSAMPRHAANFSASTPSGINSSVASIFIHSAALIASITVIGISGTSYLPEYLTRYPNNTDEINEPICPAVFMAPV